MSTRGRAPANQPCGCVSCLAILIGFWLVSWIVSVVAWTVSAVWSLLVGFSPTAVGALIAFSIGRADFVPQDKKQLSATGAFVAGLLFNALLLSLQPQLQPWVLDAVLSPAPQPGSVPASTRIMPAGNGVSIGNPISPTPQRLPAASPPVVQLESAQSTMVPLRRQKLSSHLTIRGRITEVPPDVVSEFVVERWTVKVRNNSSRSLLVEYSTLHYDANGILLHAEDGLKESANEQIRSGGIRSTRRFMLKARPKTAQVIVLNELMPRVTALQIRRSVISLTPIKTPTP